MRVTYSPRALAQLQSIFAYIEEFNPRAAKAVVDHTQATASLLGASPWMGRRTNEKDVRVRGDTKYPYLIFYKVLEDMGEVRILRVLHGAQNR
jgi:addiction module RelE/StbE family toxin